MPRITVADALAEIDSIGRLIEKKQQLIAAYLLRAPQYRDPLQALGGSAAVVGREWASIHALHERRILLRRCIQNAYENTSVTFGTQTRSLADWLAWRREVSTRQAGFLKAVASRIHKARQRAARQAVIRAQGMVEVKPVDIVVHLNEQELAQAGETLAELLGYLQGQLALKNATLTIEVPSGEECRTGLEDQLERLLRQTAALPETRREGNFPWSASPELCRLASDPVMKIAAIKKYREMTMTSLAAAKEAVEVYMARRQ